MQIQEKSFLLLLFINFPEKNCKTLSYGSDERRNSYQLQSPVLEVLLA